MTEQNKPESMKPFHVILTSFEYFRERKGLEEIDLTGMINICIACGCPNPDIAQDVLANMVEMGLLEYRKDEETETVYLKPKSDNNLTH